MNDRIKELIAQCAFTVTEYQLGIDSSYEDFDKEMFAELIVRECVKRVESKADRWGNMTDEIINRSILDCAEDLKQHFGVK